MLQPARAPSALEGPSVSKLGLRLVELRLEQRSVARGQGRVFGLVRQVDELEVVEGRARGLDAHAMMIQTNFS